MTEEKLRGILNDCHFRPSWGYRLEPYDRGWLFQVEFLSPFEEPWKRELQRGRKFYISPFATESEVVQTYWLAVSLALEHEARELFTYKGAVVFGPHIDINAHIAKALEKDARQTAGV